eukprot:3222278-Alexandrium_andersonii.AAC.1
MLPPTQGVRCTSDSPCHFAASNSSTGPRRLSRGLRQAQDNAKNTWPNPRMPTRRLEHAAKDTLPGIKTKDDEPLGGQW